MDGNDKACFQSSHPANNTMSRKAIKVASTSTIASPLASSTITIDEEIAREEQLIKYYSNELQGILSQDESTTNDGNKSNDWNFDNDSNHGDNENDPLDWILQSSSTDTSTIADHTTTTAALVASVLEAATHTNNQENDVHVRLQAAIRGFCFTNVQKLSNSSSSSSLTYQLQGYFLGNNRIHATMQMGFEKIETYYRVVSMTCKLLEKQSDGTETPLQWLEQEAASASEECRTTTSSLALWIGRMANYLTFDQARRELLEPLETQNRIRVTRVKSKSIIELPSLGVSIAWGWKWKQGQDMLRITQGAAAMGLNQHDLQALVDSCKSCQRALQVIFDSTKTIVPDDPRPPKSRDIGNKDHVPSPIPSFSSSTPSRKRMRSSIVGDSLMRIHELGGGNNNGNELKRSTKKRQKTRKHARQNNENSRIIIENAASASSSRQLRTVFSAATQSSTRKRRRTSVDPFDSATAHLSMQSSPQRKSQSPGPSRKK